MIGGRSPRYPAHAAVVALRDRQLQGLVLGPQQDLSRAAKFAELVEQEPDDAANALVGIHLDPADLVPAIAGRQHEPQFATQRLRIARRKPALAQQAQFVFGHRPLQAEQKTVIHQTGIVCAIRVDHQRADQSAQIDKVMPVAPVARQA